MHTVEPTFTDTRAAIHAIDSVAHELAPGEALQLLFHVNSLAERLSRRAAVHSHEISTDTLLSCNEWFTPLERRVVLRTVKERVKAKEKNE